MNESLQTSPRNARRFWRYSIRSLLIVVTLICISGGWYIGRVRNQQAAIRWVQQQGGKVYYRGVERELLPPVTQFEQWVVDNFGPDYIWHIAEVYIDGERDFQGNDIAPIGYFTQLRRIYLRCSDLSDISALAACEQLEDLSIEDTSIESIAPLAGLQKLKKLAISRTPLQDLSPLAQCPNLEEFFFHHTLIDNLDALANLPKLKSVCVSQQRKMPDMSALANHKSIESIAINCHDCDQIEFLNDLKQLKGLSISGTQVHDLRPINKCHKLAYLDISSSKIVDLAPLATLTQLENIEMNDTEIVDISALSKHLKLESVSAKETKIVDLSPLLACKEISYLALSDTPLKDFSTIDRMSKLNTLEIYNCNISRQLLDDLSDKLPECHILHGLDP